jgi:DNA uptake protein ComE-like DNA-binding protein
LLMLIQFGVVASRQYKVNQAVASFNLVLQMSEGALRDSGVKLLDLNLADSAELEALPGIGPVLAGRIFKFRTAIGCFKSKEEILKVYGIQEAWLIRYQDKLMLSPCAGSNLKRRSAGRKDYTRFHPRSQNRPLHPINLNVADSLELMKYEILPGWLVGRVLQERENLGCFTGWNQLERILPMSVRHLDTLKQWTELGDCPRLLKPKSSAPEKPVIRINLNLSDSVEFLRVPGIPKGVIRRILAFRSRMRFFLSHDQVLEMKNPPTREEWASLLPYLEPVDLKSLPDSLYLYLNRAGEEELGRHPYIGYSLAGRIINFRNQHGKFVSLESMGKIYGVKPGTWEKLKPYIRFE